MHALVFKLSDMLYSVTYYNIKSDINNSILKS